jgi:hypothetical protein
LYHTLNIEVDTERFLHRPAPYSKAPLGVTCIYTLPLRKLLGQSPRLDRRDADDRKRRAASEEAGIIFVNESEEGSAVRLKKAEN